MLVVGQASAGHMGHRHTTIQLKTPASTSAIDGPGRAKWPRWRYDRRYGAVYVTISNHGSEADALLSASTDVATTVELHETVEQDGKMVMRPLPKFDVPAGGKLEMKPGSYHIMLLDSNRISNREKPSRLSFEKGQMSVEAPVK
jgi:copper(I)-binding protein